MSLFVQPIFKPLSKHIKDKLESHLLLGVCLCVRSVGPGADGRQRPIGVHALLAQQPERRRGNGQAGGRGSGVRVLHGGCLHLAGKENKTKVNFIFSGSRC
jgi:hypothetical protein